MAEIPYLIAVVDDDPAVLKALTRLLRAHAFGARTYDSARAFLAALPVERPDCLIVDLKMSGMSGIELHQHLKQIGVYIPTIIMTAHGDAEMRSRCEKAGTLAFLAKPLQDTSLFAALYAARRIPIDRNAGPRPQ
jgi:FixJ family two-component response regulator